MSEIQGVSLEFKSCGHFLSIVRYAKKCLSHNDAARSAACWGFGGCKGDKGARFASSTPLSPLR